MRRLVALMVLLAALRLRRRRLPRPPPPGTTTAFVVAGGGWGHGVGMSQWGAFGQAKAGRDYHQILGTYYRGTEIGSAPAPLLERVRVLVADGLPDGDAHQRARGLRRRTGSGIPCPQAPSRSAPTSKLPVGKDGKPLALPGPLTFRATPGVVPHGTAARASAGDLRVAKAGRGSSWSTSSGSRRTCSASFPARCRRTGRSRRSRRRRSPRARMPSRTS